MYTDHAKKRMKQRGINKDIVEFIISYGQEYYFNKGYFYFISNKVKTELWHVDVGKIESANGIFVLMINADVITVAHKRKSLKLKV